ncbi:peptidoglycan editing factor PgeF [Kovacikia minuta CCNUW1]|uniref:peptidoglycan editing factor PgeF n=1 Tax=Kovacikia minuta TaxID=2931930 RepID=UPI001CCFFB36|nr:peptidoglycan editing factor PgeF [Kovacikia minuta]UBF28642.1 peptidoglycan editing factor PgeF [Kovacikia minuta CCNUW1]
MHTWQWRTWNNLPYLTCSLLESWSHGFFTQQFWSRPPVELTDILQPDAQVYRVKQVHGNTVLAPSEMETAVMAELRGDPSGDEPPAADGLITEAPNQAVWVCSADCTPVLIGDGATGQVAAVHAGWRGTALKIVPQAIARLQSQGSRLPDLRIAMGPAIAGERYQVSEQVAAQVGATLIAVEPEKVGEALEALHRLPNSPLLEDPEPGRVRLDVRRVNALQLEQLGISPEQVAIAPHCTYQDADNFFSYRRSRQKKAQWSGITSTSKRD